MAFDPSGWSPDTRPSGMKIHTYISTDAIATVNTSGYFNDLADIVNVRDIILVSDSSTPTSYWCIVLSNSSGVVDVSDGTVIAETDGD